MKSIRLNRTVAEFLDSIDDEAAKRYAPDGLDFHEAWKVHNAAYRDLERNRDMEPTAWSSMSAEERAAIRPGRRGHLRVVSHNDFPFCGNDSEEAA